MLETGNKNIVLVVGKPTSGKTASLRNMPNPDKIAYLNTDMKEVSFNSNMQELSISDPMDIFQAIEEIESNPLEMGVLDTVSFLMDQFEQQYVLTSANTQKAWGDYASFYKKVIHALKAGTKDYVVMAHVRDILNESEMVLESKVPIKGSVGHTGIEADFSIILGSKRVNLKTLKGMENELLTINEEEMEDGFKYVFQTRIDKDSLGEKMRSPIGLFNRNEKYIDNDLNKVFQRIHKYYS